MSYKPVRRPMEYLYDPMLLTNSVSQCLIANMRDFDQYKLRPLASNDYTNRYIDLLSQLTNTGHVTETMYFNTFNSMKCNGNTYFITVIEDTQDHSVVATGTLILEKKFIHSCGQRGRVEDIVVDYSYRGKGFGKLIVENLIALSHSMNCYKISLECKDTNVSWYNSMGFVTEPGNSNFMQMRLDN